ncbi:MAG: formylglycine-generating enzyme family protein [Pseudomonadota bacterium]
MIAPTLNQALQSLSITGVAGFMNGVPAGGIVTPIAARVLTAIRAAVDEFYGSATRHPLAELQAVIRGLPATGDVSPEQKTRIRSLLENHQATVDHVLRMTARFGAGSATIAGAAAVIALQAPFGLGPEWRWIPPGEFQMGSRDDDPYASDDEKPLRTIMTGGFYMLDHPVTNAEYGAFLEAMDQEDVRSFNSSFAGDYQPTFAFHDKATAYSIWLGEEVSRRIGVLLIGGLPTEVEWEKAAKGPSGNEFIIPATHEQAHFDVRATRAVNHPDAYANGYALKDMIGNVWEWTSSRCSVNSCNFVIRSCEYDYEVTEFLRAAHRIFGLPEYCLRSIGFRPVLTSQDS